MRTQAACYLAACALWCALSPARALRARCPPAAGARCRPGDDDNTFIVDGKKLTLRYSEDGLFQADCVVPLDDAAFPRFDGELRVRFVSLFGCAPPRRGSYVSALRALNITLSEQLRLYDVSGAARVDAAALADLPDSATELWISASGGRLTLEGDALSHVRVPSLGLTAVRARSLPRGLHALWLRHSGAEELPTEAWNVTRLTVQEDRLSSLAFPAPRLQTLWVSAPLRALPAAPALRTLEMHAPGTSSSSPLPRELLRGVPNLRQFTATGYSFTELPEDLFQYTPLLEDIDLSDNRIETIPSSLFSGLNALQRLRLRNNRLSALPALLGLVALRQVWLSGNPALGNVCPEGFHSDGVSMENTYPGAGDGLPSCLRDEPEETDD